MDVGAAHAIGSSQTVVGVRVTLSYEVLAEFQGSNTANSTMSANIEEEQIIGVEYKLIKRQFEA